MAKLTIILYSMLKAGCVDDLLLFDDRTNSGSIFSQSKSEYSSQFFGSVYSAHSFGSVLYFSYFFLTHAYI